MESIQSATQRDQRVQFQWVGIQYRQAIGRYYEGTPGSVRRYPPELKDLLLDARYLTVRRHVRTLYPNPYMVGAAEPAKGWTLIRAGDGGIQGVEAQDHLGQVQRFVYTPAAGASVQSGASPRPSTAR